MFSTDTVSRAYPSSGSAPTATSACSGNRLRTIRPTVAPAPSTTGSTSSAPGMSTEVRTVVGGVPPSAAATSYADNGTSHSTASSQLSRDLSSTASSATGWCSAPTRRSTERTWSCRNLRCRLTDAPPSLPRSTRHWKDRPGSSAKLAAEALGGPRTPNCQRDWFFDELARYG